MPNTPSEYLVPWLQKVSSFSPSWLYRFWKLHEVWCFWRWWWWECWWETWEGHSQHPPWSPARWSAMILGGKESKTLNLMETGAEKHPRKTSKVLFVSSCWVAFLIRSYICYRQDLEAMNWYALKSININSDEKSVRSERNGKTMNHRLRRALGIPHLQEGSRKQYWWPWCRGASSCNMRPSVHVWKDYVREGPQWTPRCVRP